MPTSHHCWCHVPVVVQREQHTQPCSELRAKESQGLELRDVSGGDRTVASMRHLTVEVLVPHVIDRAASTTHDESAHRCTATPVSHASTMHRVPSQWRHRTERGQKFRVGQAVRGSSHGDTPPPWPQEQPRACVMQRVSADVRTVITNASRRTHGTIDANEFQVGACVCWRVSIYPGVVLVFVQLPRLVEISSLRLGTSGCTSFVMHSSTHTIPPLRGTRTCHRHVVREHIQTRRHRPAVLLNTETATSMARSACWHTQLHTEPPGPTRWSRKHGTRRHLWIHSPWSGMHTGRGSERCTSLK